ncbi:nucleotidyltransferase [Faecalibacter bovis]|uniref:Nucleotidyltransferase n=1 Tax=Faecalibacter bovis TaxID=2898187 RepID=A0ABX7XDZ8_9FLAO|nr:nucleotidyltransferase [Faecalibacter bovis]QTV06064.1 nucleotidyltransferase [Faecalibacter bovis]
MSVEQYQNTMIAAKERNAALSGLTSTSKTSIWRLMFYCVAFAIEQLAQLFSQHRKEIDDKIAKQKTHRLAWIQGMYLNFQYGFDLIPETDQFDNSNATDDQISESKIIKYCAVNESDTQREVIIKIATEVEGELSPLPQEVMETIDRYTSEIKGTGVPYRIINYVPDLLRLKIRVFRDPLLIDEQGMHRRNANFPVEDALKEFMKELPFDGALQIQDLSNKLESVTGVELVSVDLVQSCWVNPATSGYGDWRSIDVRKVPESGYFKIENFNGISYEVLQS